MCATCSSVLVLPRPSWCVWAVNRRAPPQPARMRPACSSLSSLPGVAGRSLSCLPGVAGQGFALRVCLRLRVRLACVRVRAAWSSWCARACLRASGVHACGCGVGVRAAARVRSRCSSRQLHFLRRAFGSGRVSDVEVREFVGLRKSRFTKSTSSKSSKGSKVKVVKF